MKNEMGKYSYIRVDKKVCRHCCSCVRACPTHTIRMRNRMPVFRSGGLCIGCGECSRVCPAGAMKAATAPCHEIEKGPPSVALVSPVLYTQFPGASPELILSVLKDIGFNYVVDGSYFCEMFQAAAELFIRRNREKKKYPWPLISPVCPVAVRLIAMLFPSLIDHILPIMRPVGLMVREINRVIGKQYTDRNQSLVRYYLNPCPTKRDSESASFHHEKIHAERALGINDVFGEMTQRIEKIQARGNEKRKIMFDQEVLNYHPTGSSLGWAVSGGEISGMKDIRAIAVSGLRETISYLEKIEMGVLGNMEYIEFRTCPEGCVGGTLTGLDKFMAKHLAKESMLQFGLERRISRELVIERFDSDWFHARKGLAKLARKFANRREPLSIEGFQKIEEILDLIRGMDCSACGAPDCKTFAEDVVRGEASLDECLVLQARSARKKGGKRI